MKKEIVSVIAFVLMGLVTAGVLVGKVNAALQYGTGYYVNLCGGGTTANTYSCNSGCNPSTGECKSDNEGVVKYICTGKWDQCLESESYWSNQNQVTTLSCGKTVQLSLFDKKCRREDGSWDQSCKLLGYMVWYSGDCWNGGSTYPTPIKSTTSPTVRPSMTPTPSPTRIPTPTNPFTPTVSPTSKLGALISTAPSPTLADGGVTIRVCGQRCTEDKFCGAGFVCSSGVCRNAACTADKTCFCGAGATASGQKSPQTGGEVLWIGIAGLVLGSGIVFKSLSKRVW